MQPNAQLPRHYDAKYAQPTEPQVITARAYPVQRLEACVHYFPRFFKGGRILELGAGNGTLVRRLLKPGGFTYIDTPNIAKFTRRIKLLLGRFPSTASKDEGLTTYGGAPADLYDEGHLHYFTYRSLSRMLTGCCGFGRIARLSYTSTRLFGRRVDGMLARAWPAMFSEVALVAFAGD